MKNILGPSGCTLCMWGGLFVGSNCTLFGALVYLLGMYITYRAVNWDVT